MSKSRNYAMTALIILLWVIILWSALILLLGCEGMQARDQREGTIQFHADCDDDVVRFQFDLNQDAEDKKVEVKGAP